MNENTTSYRVGIDVGTHSIGFSAIQTGPTGTPTNILTSTSFIHDGGVDPDHHKAGDTRRAVSGTARRVRRLMRRTRTRLDKLDTFLSDNGFPIITDATENDPHEPWLIRATLATTPITSATQLDHHLSIAVRHMARHRGWRNPYQKVDTLLGDLQPSPKLIELKNRVEEHLGARVGEQYTPATLICAILDAAPTTPIRGADGILAGTLHQCDYALELRRIQNVQHLNPTLVDQLIRLIFAMNSPIGSARHLVGKDTLPGMENEPRCEKAQPVFQRFRIIQTVANLRVLDGGHERHLTRREMNQAVTFLSTATHPTWGDVADTLTIDRRNLTGTARQTSDGEFLGTHPPIDQTRAVIRALNIRPLTEWWDKATDSEKAAFIDATSNVGTDAINEDALESVNTLFASLDASQRAKIDAARFPLGRAAYSAASLERLCERMMHDNVDLHEARAREFNVPDGWQPPADPIGTPTGNPKVDRVLKQVARWLAAVTQRYGTPISITIETARGGLNSEKVARQISRDNQKAADRNRQLADRVRQLTGQDGTISHADITRMRIWDRQGGACLYCGTPIAFTAFELDHIVPRSGPASTNRLVNLAAVCRTCNHEKGATPFAAWADGSSRTSLGETVSRVKAWKNTDRMPVKAFATVKRDVIARLKRRRPDEPLDDRSLESVAWMAVELRHRIDSHYGGTVDVRVYAGHVTASARRASGLERDIRMIGGGGKTRLDRRHHAVDAAVLAMMRPSIAHTLTIRDNMRRAHQLTGVDNQWWEFDGVTTGDRLVWHEWRDHMRVLTGLLNEKLDNMTIPVTMNVRLSVPNAAAHDATIRPLDRHRVGAAWTVDEVDRASTPALWCALTRQDDFTPGVGLPANQNRRIMVNGTPFEAGDEVGVFPALASAVAVRGGWASIGGTVHHSRIYRVGKRFYQLRVFAVDVARSGGRDVFSIELPPKSISVRTANEKLREALARGDAEYVGWVVRGDTLRLESTDFKAARIRTFFDTYPVREWTVTGFESAGMMNLRPTLLSSEGLPDDAPDDVRVVLKRCWRVSVNDLMTVGHPSVVRRNTLGEVRMKDTKLPATVRLA